MTYMIDWVTAWLPIDAGSYVSDGHFILVDRDGVIERQSMRWYGVEGSHEARISVRGLAQWGSFGIELSGNPSKFLQGHNVFGSGDLVGLVELTLQRVLERLRLRVTGDEWARVVAGDYELTRVDTTRSYDLGSADMVRKWLTVATAFGHGGRQRVDNPSAFNGGTLYVGKNSRRVSLKLYGKGDELRKHPLAESVAPADRERLAAFAAPLLRAEVTLRGMELKKRGLKRAVEWSAGVGDSVIDERIGKLTMLDATRLEDDRVGELPAKLVAVYDAWRAGRDLRAMYSRNTYYKYRRELLPYGVDIRVVRPRVVVSKTEYAMGRPMKDFLAGPGIAPPEWAEGTELLAVS